MHSLGVSSHAILATAFTALLTVAVAIAAAVAAAAWLTLNFNLSASMATLLSCPDSIAAMWSLTPWVSVRAFLQPASRIVCVCGGGAVGGQ